MFYDTENANGLVISASFLFKEIKMTEPFR
jgi:hypothetical protein